MYVVPTRWTAAFTLIRARSKSRSARLGAVTSPHRSPQYARTKTGWRSLHEGIDTSNAAGRMVAGVLASLAEFELELGKERRTASRDARRARGQSIRRPKALDQSKVALAQRMHASGEPATTIASALGVSHATVYRVVAD